MKQFLYLDYDIVNSILAQVDKGLTSELSHEIDNGNENTATKGLDISLEGGASSAIWKLAKVEANLGLRGTFGDEKSSHSSSRDVITKTLHDAAFDMVYSSITPSKIQTGNQMQDDFGAYIELRRVFDVVDFDYLENLFASGGIVDLIKKSTKDSIEAKVKDATLAINRPQQRSTEQRIQAEIKKAVALDAKQYDDIKVTLSMMRQLIPYNRMLISSDGYLIPLDEKYFRINPTNLGFKYGGEITCVGMITNIIGKDTNPNDNKNVFATLQYSVNEMLRMFLPTKEDNLAVIHPIAVFYGA
jgi:hypothetical protein